jgi:large subunit ribosomal protein L25
MHDFSLKLDKRTAQGKQTAKLRADGYVPSVVYGANEEVIIAQSLFNETAKIVKEAGKHSPVNLTIDGEKKLAIIKSIDIDPVKRQVRHVAFHLIRRDEIIETEVPIVLIGRGESVAERAGLVVLQAIEKIEIKAKPADLPESLELSIADLASTDDRITVADIKLPSGVEFADIEQNLELVIANVYEPSALQAANEAAGGDAEPEAEAEVPAENGTEETAESAEGESAEGESKQKTE